MSPACALLALRSWPSGEAKRVRVNSSPCRVLVVCFF